MSLTHNETHLYFISHGIKFLGQSFGLIHRKRSAAGVLTTSRLSLIATPFPLPATSSDIGMKENPGVPGRRCARTWRGGPCGGCKELACLES